MTTAPFEPEPQIAPGQPGQDIPAADPNRPGQSPEAEPDEG